MRVRLMSAPTQIQLKNESEMGRHVGPTFMSVPIQTNVDG